MSSRRRPVYFSQEPASTKLPGVDGGKIKRFHQNLPGYAPSRLVPLPDLAKELGIKGVFLKDESVRLGLPSFKILGASWGTFKALTSKLRLPDDVSFDKLAVESMKQQVKLFAATDGNHGRAVARVANLLSIQAFIYVPASLDDHTKEKISREGAQIVVFEGDYDEAVLAAGRAANHVPGGMLIQDTAFTGYEDIPAAIVEGYSTMFTEIDEDLERQGLQATAVVTPVGVGSLASAVVRHYAAINRPDAKIIAVEPDTAACLYKSLQNKTPTKIQTSHTIMTGMNCGTVSSTAWQCLSDHVAASMTVSDFEAHQAVQYLRSQGVSSGPCGASGLAAIRRLSPSDRARLGLDVNSILVLLNTEGERAYDIPVDVSTDDPVELTRLLTQIESTNPTLSSSNGTGETRIADYIEAWLQHRGIDSRRLESVPGRPSVLGFVPGKREGRNIMLNGHIDTVSISNYTADPLSGELSTRDGKAVVLGRGSLDMKAGLAAAMTVLSSAASSDLDGGVILAAVADEEDRSKGTEDVLGEGLRVDAAVVTEPTMLTLGTGHKGFLWLEIEVLGVAAHGSDASSGVDAILNTGLVLNSLREYGRTLPTDEFLGQATLHCGFISGGEELSTYPASCNLKIELRTVPSQEPELVLGEISQILAAIAAKDPQFRYKQPRILLHRAAYKLEADHPFERLAKGAAEDACNTPVKPTGLKFWCDAALLSTKGIPTVVFGPKGQGLHADEEWVEVESIRQTEQMLTSLVNAFCVT
ncbi:hypothetical protein HRR83_007946 [Exophiala dermatitidis]|uniref:Diaminopropionate ammonia-lyase n=2 Tax=Exophiala dermatitidis TaxID=5970 RepID=H6BUI6_EXODN|nr:diaminopropionate ammonia-lyase [Exophiala dermatitidis NIH/UT8656]KAJ4506542.1 hypothetical protein HRR75_006783 [Exophiala dermatitidis]EHY55728.1 diaminopropionate ammonia-lyase [Exophiala dermatitidis NIH/UT8656]KAJ4508809.1 hypothetical protein HRR74_007400 [Exophiala dermatitidis]KAJ4539063.1 hypothetical protein HRR77_006479 [Exophiala dermatitidis]KAJ4540656.1 hypothetical protein HRR76_004044 [Exophiala dermatitidis]